MKTTSKFILSQNSVFDRFIPLRINSDTTNFSLIDLDETNILFDIKADDDEDDDISSYKFVNTAKMTQNLFAYRNRLLDALNIQDFVTVCKKRFEKSMRRKIIKPWPVIARKRPIIESPEFILDIPAINDEDVIFCRHKIDWGSSNKIAMIFNGEVHLLCGLNGENRSTNLGETAAFCLKWNKLGTRFAVSTNNGFVMLIDGETLKCLNKFKCDQRCILCDINVIEWTKRNQMLIGCSNGIMKKIGSKPRHRVYSFKSGIVDLKLSCNDIYLFIMMRDSAYINRFGTVNNVNLKTSNSVCASWHPWQEHTLAVSDLQNKSVFIYNCNTNIRTNLKILNPYLISRFKCVADCVSFNPISAELVVSFYSDEDEGWSYLTVFSDLETRVDEVRFHRGRVPHFLWDSTGTKLGSSGVDENLAIWNFFGSKPLPKNKVYLKNQLYDLKTLKYQRIR
ncbi:protein cortex-like [Anthonomus grandis grandis]|uniref:protein cortex-like n=1 Tax=Anthonomus grandis grandis TaxID=2921223 RepID=UPI002165415C|nr:protein cortex-like [Anthonomus grandis grandis]